MNPAGAAAERRAALHYRLRGYRLLAANEWIAGYELDLVVRRGRKLTFVEVKQKTDDRFGDPAEMVDDEKQRRLRRTAEAWLARHPECANLTVSFDVVAVSGDRLTRIGNALT